MYYVHTAAGGVMVRGETYRSARSIDSNPNPSAGVSSLGRGAVRVIVLVRLRERTYAGAAQECYS
jgi:hypothetical protein